MAIGELLTIGAGMHNVTRIPVIIDMSSGRGIELSTLAQSGDADPTFSAVSGFSPKYSFSTHALGLALTTLGLDGTACTSLAKFLVYYTQIDEQALRTAGLAHRKCAINYGLVVPVSLSLAVGEFAKLNYEVHVGYDGTNAPLIFTASEALPAWAAVSQAFTLGKVKINAAIVPGVQSVDVQFGYEVLSRRSNNDVYPTFLAIMQRNSKITIETNEPYNLATLGVVGTSSSTNTAEIYAQKYSSGGSLVADATAEHVSLSAAQWQCTPEGESVSQNQVLANRFVLTPIKKAEATAILAFSATATIPAS